MANIEISSIIASLFSVVLAILAIVLSIIFFRMSLGFSESTKEASKNIGACVERIEKLFDKLYADTFSIVRETVSDMRKHIWPEEIAETDKVLEEAEKKANKKLNSVKDEMNTELLKMFKRQDITNSKLSSVKSEMRDLIDKATSSIRKVEINAREETIQGQILNAVELLQRNGLEATAIGIVERFEGKLPAGGVVRELTKMAKEGKISLGDRKLGPDTLIRIMR